ncbi:hypothetical protein [Micromonospora sediminicola]|nr:hypothetical protein [Micromonospora sediminicola]
MVYDASDPTAAPRARQRDHVSDAWMLAEAETARRRTPEPGAVRVLLLPHRSEAVDRSPAVVWFAPGRPAMTEALNGHVHEAQVEAAIVLGLARWGHAASPPPAPGWYARRHAMGLALHDPTGLPFAGGLIEVPVGWTTTALVSGVIAAYGVPAGSLPPTGDGRRIAQLMSAARRLGLIAAGRVPLRW